MQLRPHHLLCTQGFSGKGYNEQFAAHMAELVSCLRREDATRIDLVYTTDDLCAYCPNKLGEDCCRDNEKVREFDRKTVTYFGLEEKEYIYQELIQQIDAQMTEEMLTDICGNCGWYPISACKKNILGKEKLPVL